MSKKSFISILLSLMITFSSTFAQTYIYDKELPRINLYELQKKYPKGKFIKVSASRFEEIKSQGRVVSVNGTKMVLLPIDKHQKLPFNVSGFHFPNLCNHSGGAECLYLVAFIGVLFGVYMVAVLVANGLYILGDVAFNQRDTEKWLEIGLTASSFSYLKEDSETRKSSAFGGLSFSGGFIENRVGIGFVSEIGHIDLDREKESIDNKRVYGAYGMIGPTFRYDFSRISSFHLDVMAGISDVKDVAVMGVTRVGLNFKIAKHAFFDINYGVNYLELKNIGDKVEGTYNDTVGINFGYRF